MGRLEGKGGGGGLSGRYLRDNEALDIDAFGRNIDLECRCAMLWCDLDLTFDRAVVTLTFKILSGLYLRTRKE